MGLMNDLWDDDDAGVINWNDHVRQSYATLIVEHCGIIDADANGFTIHCGDGTRKVDLTGGLTKDDYEYYAPLLDDLGKATLATGVLKKLLEPATWIEFDVGWQHICRMHGNRPEEEWLPSLVATVGFAAIANDMTQAVKRFHQANPRAFMATPHWDGMVLTWRATKWRFRNQIGPVRDVLDALGKAPWPPSVKLGSLDPDQVHDAARHLRDKTLPDIDWHSSNDCTLSWSTQ